MKKITSAFLALALAVSLFAPAAVADQIDESKNGGVILLSDTEDSGSPTDPIEPTDPAPDPGTPGSESGGGTGGESGGGSGENPGGGSTGGETKPPETTPPTEKPTDPPTEKPTDPPTEKPTDPPTEKPTDPPTEKPTDPPTEKPTDPPTEKPTEKPTEPTIPETTTPTTPPTPTTPTTPPYTGVPSITKHPTGENVKEGGYAEFVARANFSTDIIWHLKNPGGSIDILAKDAPEQFPGLVVTGLNSERLGLNNIPRTLNEWRIQAEFVGRDGNVWSDAAVINVTNHELKAPTIQSHPMDANLKATEKVTLSVVAESAEANTTLTYQWYKNTANSNAGGRAILGATNATYSPDYVAGTSYYYCLVRSSNGSENSAAVKSRSAAVTYAAAEQATLPTAGTEIPGATLEPWATATETLPTSTAPEALPDVPNAPARSHTLLFIILGSLAVIAVLGVIAVVVIMKVYPRGEEEEAPAPRQPAPRPKAPRQPNKPAPMGKAPREADFYDSFGKQQDDDQWDDLSDLGDLSIYLGDDFDDQHK